MPAAAVKSLLSVHCGSAISTLNLHVLTLIHRLAQSNCPTDDRQVRKCIWQKDDAIVGMKHLNLLGDYAIVDALAIWFKEGPSLAQSWGSMPPHQFYRAGGLHARLLCEKIRACDDVYAWEADVIVLRK